MPTAATTTAGGTQQSTDARNGRERQTVPVVPFIRASAEHREPVSDNTRALSTSGTTDLGVLDVPAYGYMRSIVLVVTCTGLTAAAAMHEDGPFSVLQNIQLTEPNGAVLCQFNSGYDLYLANKWGGYRYTRGSDPKASPVYSTDANGNFTFLLRIPVELNLRDALGSLPNQNSAASFKLRIGLASAANGAGLYAAAITGTATVRVRAYLEAWDQPELQAGGQSNQVTPPAMNTTQFWTVQTFNVSAGQQNVRLTRVGNYLRNLILVQRRAGTSRANGHSDIPDPTTLYLDTRPLDIIERNNWLHQMYERSGNGGKVGATTPAADAASGLDNGVFVYDFMHEFDGSLGQENRDLWMPTLGSTRLELTGQWANAGTLTVLTNDVAIAGSVFI